MKHLVVFYSRTGVTRKVAQNISRHMNCDIEEVVDTKDRSGAKGYLVSGRDAMLKKLTEIKDPTKDPAAYDTVIIGTPVWAFTMAPAVRTYIQKNKERLKKVAFFCTQGGSGSKKTFKDMQELCTLNPLGLLELNTSEVVKGDITSKLEQFIREISK